MYYADLTVFPQKTGDIIAVGWLSLENVFPRGVVPQNFVRRLAKLSTVPRCPTFGVHPCDFCEGEERPVGNGQIHVPAGGGRWYAAPQLIYHYVVAHTYRPPDEYIVAVLLAPPSAFKPFAGEVGRCPSCRKTVRLWLRSRPREIECERCGAELLVARDDEGWCHVSLTSPSV